ACKLKEIEQFAEIELILLRNLNHKVRHISVRMSKNCTVHCTLIDEINILSCKIVQSVQINRLFIDDDLFPGLFYIDNSLALYSVSVLKELTHGAQVCCKVNRCREDTFLVFSFSLPVELFPPLRYIMQARLIVCQIF